MIRYAVGAAYLSMLSPSSTLGTMAAYSVPLFLHHTRATRSAVRRPALNLTSTAVVAMLVLRVTCL
jgi:hypothetical protein